MSETMTDPFLDQLILSLLRDFDLRDTLFHCNKKLEKEEHYQPILDFFRKTLTIRRSDGQRQAKVETELFLVHLFRLKQLLRGDGTDEKHSTFFSIFLNIGKSLCFDSFLLIL
jgi:hypothetical protein